MKGFFLHFHWVILLLSLSLLPPFSLQCLANYLICAFDHFTNVWSQPVFIFLLPITIKKFTIQVK